MPSTTPAASSRCACRSSSTARAKSRGSACSGRKPPAAWCATRRRATPRSARRARATSDGDRARPGGRPMNAAAAPTVDLQAILRDTHVLEVLEELDRDLVGLAPVKKRIQDIAAFLVVSKARSQLGLEAASPSLNMAQILHRLGYVRKGHVVSVTRDDLVGQYIGHTAPKTKEVLKRAMGGVLFIDEAYYLYRPENERDYGQEAIEILLQVMENNRDDLVVILAGYKDRMDTFFKSNPGMSSRIAHHIDFPDYGEAELMQIAERMLAGQHYHFGPGAREAFAQYIERRMQQPHFANARSVRNALDRARLRAASRLFAVRDRALTESDLTTLAPEDILASRVFAAAA